MHRLQFLLDFPDLFLLLFDLSVTDFGYFTVVAFTFGLIGFKLQVFDINLILLNLIDLLFFRFATEPSVSFLRPSGRQFPY